MINPAYTVSVHHGNKVVQPHNVRDPKYVLKELHIDPNGTHEIWHHENLKEAYHRIFDCSVFAYNSIQCDKRREIPDYYQKIKNSKQKNLCYEVIVTIGNKDSRPDDEVCKEIMKHYVDGWKKRNPNLELIGAYYHADEPGAPHVHIDYIPVAYNNTKGMKVQNSQTQALREMGYYNFNRKYGETELIIWERDERNYLDDICRVYGIDIYHPNEGRKHLEKEQYILTQEIAELENQKGYVQDAINDLYSEYQDVLNKKISDKKEIEKLKNHIEEIKSTDRYIARAVDFYDAFLKVSIYNEFDPKIRDVKELVEQQIKLEKIYAQELANERNSYRKYDNPDYDRTKDFLSIDYEY